MSKEQVAEIMLYCQEHGMSHKARLAELGCSAWSFYESRRRYAKEQEENPSSVGEFLQLTAGGGFVPAPSFSTNRSRKPKTPSSSESRMMNVELRTPNGTVMRIQGEFTQSLLQSIIQASSSSHV